MTRKEKMFIVMRKAIDLHFDITVYISISGNSKYESVFSHNCDIASKIEYYDEIYDDDLQHKTADVRIVGWKPAP